MAGHNLAQVAGELDYGLALIDRSLSLNPNSANAWTSSCFIRTFLDEIDTALEHFARAQRLNPLDSLHHVHWNAAAMAHFAAGRYDEAVKFAEKTLNERPTYPPALRMMVAICGLRGQRQEGRAYRQRLLAVNPDASVSRLRALFEVSMRRHPRQLTAYLEGVRRAGLPEGA
jgi:tetratricopeptide (TPR) repeat protein